MSGDVQLFTEDEYKQLIVLACKAKDGATEDEIQCFIHQCATMRTQALMLEAIQIGWLVVDCYKDGEPMFRSTAPP